MRKGISNRWAKLYTNNVERIVNSKEGERENNGGKGWNMLGIHAWMEPGTLPPSLLPLALHNMMSHRIPDLIVVEGAAGLWKGIDSTPATAAGQLERQVYCM